MLKAWKQRELEKTNRHRNVSQNKERDNIPSRELSQAEISNMPATLIKAMVKNTRSTRKECRT